MNVTLEVNVEDPKSVDAAVKFLSNYMVVALAKTPTHKATKPASAPAPAPTPAPVVAAPVAQTNDRNAVKDALKSLAQLAGKDPAVKILNDHGASSISELSEDKFDMVHALAVAAVTEFPVPEAADDEFC